MTNINYDERIPNNVGIGDNRRLKRALEAWQPAFLDWWRSNGPDGFMENDIYLRTAISVEPDGWMNFDYVKMPDYRWGVFLMPTGEDRKINFGRHKGEPAWQEVPGEYRAPLRRMIVIQGDTEPASVEQQRYLGHTCPSLYDLRSLFQVNVEEGRHLWAMAYLLHAYFGRDGRDEADALLQRHSGHADRPRILGAFNEKTPDWLSFFMFTTFTDRDGKFQLASLAESGFDPLARSCQFMLREEGYHMSTGERGVGRIVRRTCEVMREHKTDDVRKHGVVDLPTLQKYVNFHCSVSMDLFGAEISTNAANSYAMGIKGRFREETIDDDHVLTDASYPVEAWTGSEFKVKDEPALTALNERLRNDYYAECARIVEGWSEIIREHGIDFELTLPHHAFHRAVGSFAEMSFTPTGEPISKEQWNESRDKWVPNDDDHAFVGSLMQEPTTEPGKFANWIAPPDRGLNRLPLDFEYVRLA